MRGTPRKQKRKSKSYRPTVYMGEKKGRRDGREERQKRWERRKAEERKTNQETKIYKKCQGTQNENMISNRYMYWEIE